MVKPTVFLTIGTRGSPLALAQAYEVQGLLAALHGVALDQICVEMFKTSGDRIQDRPLSEVGGKGLFSKEIEDALIEGHIDLAVHSAKDLATELPHGLDLSVFLPREDVRDAFISLSAKSLDDLPHGAKLGTSSLRRAAQMRRYRPDLEVVQFRGNVGTRLEKLARGVADATLLAAAGLKRLGQAEKITAFLDPEIFPPAPAQGAIGVECRTEDVRTRDLIAPLNHRSTAEAVVAERAFLKELDGSCRTPIAALSTRYGDEIELFGQILSPDGKVVHQGRRRGLATNGVKIGTALGAALLAEAGPGFFEIFGEQ